MNFIKSVFKGGIVFLIAMTHLITVISGGWYYVGGYTYMYHSKDVELDICFYLVAALLSTVLLIIIVSALFRAERGTAKRFLAGTALLFFHLGTIVLGFQGCATNLIVGPNGCSYTDDITSYGTYDDITIVDNDHFPKEITEDMTVIDFTYYYKNVDRSHVDLYLEVKFENEEIMKRYIDEAIAGFGECGGISYQNPYNPKYTDVVKNRANLYFSENGSIIAEILFTEYGDIERVEMVHVGISYSYEELTLIYNCTDMGTDIFVGNDPENGEYYSKYLEHFGVKWNPENDFRFACEAEDEAR